MNDHPLLKIIYNKVDFLLYTIIYLMFILLIIINLRTNYIIGYDDSFTYAIIHHSFRSIINLTTHDVHPFLYYFMAKIFIQPFHNPLAQIKSLKILSAIPYLILLIISNTSIRKHYSNRVAIIFMFIITTMPILNQNSCILRMYGWVLLFTTITYLMMMYIYHNILKNSFINCCIISIFALAAAYTHYYALIAVTIMYIIFIGLFIYSKKPIKYLLLSIFIDIILYSPWLKNISNQISNVHSNYWAQPLTIKSTFTFIKLQIWNIFNETNILNNGINTRKTKIFIIIIILGFSILLIKFTHVNHINLDKYFGIILPIFIVFIGLFISFMENHQVILPRYIISTLGIFWLCISILINKLITKTNINKLVKIVMLFIIIFIGIKSYSTTITQLRSLTPQFTKTTKLLNKIPRNSNIIFNNLATMGKISPYFSHGNLYVMKDSHKNKQIITPLLTHVFNNYNKKYISSIPKHTSKSIYYIKTIKGIGINQINHNFYYNKRYKFTKIAMIYTPLCANKSILYRVTYK